MNARNASFMKQICPSSSLGYIVMVEHIKSDNYLVQYLGLNATDNPYDELERHSWQIRSSSLTKLITVLKVL